MKSTLQTWLRLLLSAFFITMGTLHFAAAEPFIAIVPSVLPFPRELVYLSGLGEILGGLGILPVATRQWAGFGLIALLIAVFPANINQALNNIPIQGRAISPLVLWARLPLQFVLMAWVWWCTLSGKPMSQYKS